MNMPGMRRTALAAAALALAALALAAPAALAASAEGRLIADTGLPARNVPACVSCHGQAGEGVVAQNGPRLAHADARYLQAQLDAFAAGTRPSSVMQPVAAKLSAGDMAEVAAYFAGLPAQRGVQAAPPPPSPRGRALAEEGDWPRQAPPCAACHGPQGEGVGALVPLLAGQSRAYLFDQLEHFRDGQRRDDPMGLMRGVVMRLTPADLAAAADYYAGAPLPKPEEGKP